MPRLFRAMKAPIHWIETEVAQVYFIQEGEDGPIKVGHTKNIDSRFKTLQTAHHRPLRILLLLDGDSELEESLHQKFRHLHIHGEWYMPDVELLDFIREAKKW